MGANDQGALTEAVYYILLSLLEPMHGYGIMQHVKELSKGRVNLGPGTLYGAINSLVDKGWIQAMANAGQDADSRKKAYAITGLGTQVVTQEIQRLKELVNNGELLLSAHNQSNWI